MKHIELVERDPKELKNHNLNIVIYGDHIDDEFVEATKGGIENPLTVCRSSDPLLNDVVVKGRRRRIAALTHKFKTVPCIMWDCDDPLEVERQLVTDNVRNETTEEERGRMYEHLKRIETAIAERRMKAGKKPEPDPTGKIPQGPDSTKQGVSDREKTAAEKAAKQVGRSVKTAEKSVEVVHAIDKLEADGKTEEAAEVRDTLNNGTVAAAVRKVAEVTAPASKAPTEDQQHSKDIDKQSVKLVASIAAAVTSAEEMMKAIDNKCRGSEPMRNRKKKFETLLHKMRDLLEPVEHHAGIVAKAWSDTKGQVDQ